MYITMSYDCVAYVYVVHKILTCFMKGAPLGHIYYKIYIYLLFFLYDGHQ